VTARPPLPGSPGPACVGRAGLACAGLVLAALGAGCRPRAAEVTHDAGLAVAPAPAAAPAVAASDLVFPSGPGSLAAHVDRAAAGVVALRARTAVKNGPGAMYPGTGGGAEDGALGTGFVIDHGGRFVLTTEAIAGASGGALEAVATSGERWPCRVIGRDARLGVALLAFDPPAGGDSRGDGAAVGPRQALRMGDSDAAKVGEWVLALGNPFGDEVTASAGIVSATGAGGAGAVVSGRGLALRTFLQTDARVHRGNAGGPVVDLAGAVIGIAVAVDDRPTELSFVIPISRVREVLDPLRDVGSAARSWLGVLAAPVTPALAAQLMMPAPAGALVTEVKAGSPGAKAGLRAGDVITHWAGAAVDHRELPWRVASTPVGRVVEVALWRSGGAITASVTTEKMPE
jgi:serine protease Do